MKKSDKELGMDRPITRRDLLHGRAAPVADAADLAHIPERQQARPCPGT